MSIEIMRRYNAALYAIPVAHKKVLLVVATIGESISILPLKERSLFGSLLNFI